jgi:hypothetical protein
MEPMSRNRQIVTTVIVLALLIGGLLWALWQLGVVKECIALLNCG